VGDIEGRDHTGVAVDLLVLRVWLVMGEHHQRTGDGDAALRGQNRTLDGAISRLTGGIGDALPCRGTVRQIRQTVAAGASAAIVPADLALTVRLTDGETETCVTEGSDFGACATQPETPIVPTDLALAVGDTAWSGVLLDVRGGLYDVFGRGRDLSIVDVFVVVRIRHIASAATPTLGALTETEPETGSVLTASQTASKTVVISDGGTSGIRWEVILVVRDPISIQIRRHTSGLGRITRLGPGTVL